MENAAKFRPLTNKDKPEKGQQTVLLLIKEEGRTRSEPAKFLPIQAYPIFEHTLDGWVLTVFRPLVGDSLCVTNSTIVGWCPIDPTPPIKE